MIKAAWIRVALRNSKEAFQEFLYLCLFSFMPIWLAALAAMLVSKSLSTYFNDFLYSGEALLVSATTVGPLMYFITKDYHKRDDGFSRSFPFKSYLVIMIVAICIISALFVGLRTVPNATSIISKDVLWAISLLIFLWSLVLWFSTMILKNSIEAAPAIMRQDTDNFLDEWNR